MNYFSDETKIRKMVFDLVQPSIVQSSNTMIETKTQEKELLSRVKLLEKRLNRLKKDTIIAYR
jgi:hypothetical protein